MERETGPDAVAAADVAADVAADAADMVGIGPGL